MGAVEVLEEDWRRTGRRGREATLLVFGNLGFVCELCDSCDFGGLWKQASS